jgi:two-component sensor histidine kinase
MALCRHVERIVELEEDNRRLRHLLDQQDTPNELRHRLRSTLSLLRAIIRNSGNTGRDRPDYAAQLEDRLDAIVRAQALADQYGKVDLRTLIEDELFQYTAAEGERLVLSGPEVELQPKAGQVLALAIHELAVNAVEHGALGADKGRVEVFWSVAADEPSTPLLLGWTEFGLAPNAGPARRGFGTEVLTRMLAYEQKAETSITFGPEGIQFKLRLPMPEHVGRVVP